MPHPDKEQIIALVNHLLNRSGLNVDQVLARMQAHGCDLTRSAFENSFTTRVNRPPNVPPQWTLALIAAFTERLTEYECCTAAEAIELARLARLPIDQFEMLKNNFPEAEFIAAYSRYAPTPGLAVEESNEDRRGLGDLCGLDLRDLTTPCPYQGLRAFDEEHVEFFFGRETETEWMLETLQESRFLAVIGPSGIGKSSVVRAGLIPALRRGAFRRGDDTLPSSGDPWQACGPDPGKSCSEQWLLYVFEPGRRPLESLAVALLEAGQTTPERSLRALIDELETDERGLHLLVLEILARQPGKTYLTLVVDQFEEAFTLCEDEAARQAFIANLLYAASLLDGQTIVILTMRADFYSRAALYPNLALYLAEHQVLISPLAETGLTEAITRPAQQAGLYFEPGLVDRLLQDAAAEPGVLPLLQYALLELWERRAGNTLTLAAYQASGGVHGALTQRAGRLLAIFTPAQQAIVRRVMLRLTKLGEGTADTRRLAAMAELARTPAEEADVRIVVSELADARLVTTSVNRETGEETVEVTHEALIRGWPTLQSWLAEDREALRLHQQLAEATREWHQNNRDESYLYRGIRLATAEAWAETHASEMNVLEQTFLTASLAERDRIANEREYRRRRIVWGLSLGLVVTLIGLAVVLGLGWLALDQWRQLETERQAAFSRQLAAHALDRLDDRLDLALLLSAEAYQVADTVKARSSLLTALEAGRYLTAFLRGHTDWVNSVAFSPDGRTLASGSADGTIILWDVSTRLNAGVDAHQSLGPPLTGHTDWVRSVAFSPGGHTLASGSADNTIILWDVDTRQPLGPPLAGHTSFVTKVAFSPDTPEGTGGKTLASGSADGTIILWDISTAPVLSEAEGLDTSISTFLDGTGQPLAYALTRHKGFVLDLAFSPDGQTLASGSEDNTVMLWDVDTRQPLGSPLTGHRGAVSSVAFSPDTPEDGAGGQILASGSADGTIRLWSISISPDADAPTVRPLGEPLAGHESDVTGLTFSPDGRLLASSSKDKSIILWEITRPVADEIFVQPLGPPLEGHAAGVLDVAFSPNAENPGRQLLASGSADGTVILWNTRAGLPLSRRLTGHTDLVTRIAFSPNPVEIEGRERQLLASGSRDQTVILWDVETGQSLGSPLTGHTYFVSGLAFSPARDAVGRQILASGDEYGTVLLWDVATGRSLEPPLVIDEQDLPGLVFSPDGQTLAVGGEKLITLWDVTTHQQLGQPFVGDIRIQSVAFSPDGQTLASGVGNKVMLWDVATRQPLGPPLTGHTSFVPGLTFSPNGQTLASGGGDGTVRLWDTATRRPIRQPLVGHTETVPGVAFSPDGQTLISGSIDGAIILWNVATRQMLGRPLSVNEHVFSLAFSPDGQTLAVSGGEDGAVILWAATPEAWRERVCRLAGRNLTLDEWQRYLGDEPYRATCPDAPLPAMVGSLPLTPTIMPTPLAAATAVQTATSAVIVEDFDSGQGFIQTSPNVYIDEGQVQWHFQRSGGKQYVYRSIPPFSGDVHLMVTGQVYSATNNCQIRAGIGDKPRSGLGIGLGYFGGGCETNGAVALPVGASFNMRERACEFTGDWLWLEESTPYTVELTISDGTANLSVEGVGSTAGTPTYAGVYTTLWVGNTGDGDWPECEGTIDAVIVEPLE